MWYFIVACVVLAQLTIEDRILYNKYGKDKHGFKNNASLALFWGPVFLGLFVSLWVNAKDPE
jgi:hypothetical protein